MPQEAIQEKIDSGLIQVFTKQDGAKRSGIPEVGMQLRHSISDHFVEHLHHEQVYILKRTCRFSLIQPELRILKLSLPTIDATYIEYWYE